MPQLNEPNAVWERSARMCDTQFGLQYNRINNT